MNYSERLRKNYKKNTFFYNIYKFGDLEENPKI